MADLAIPSHGTIPLTEIVRARVAGHRVAMPVDGSGVVQLRNITAMPTGGGGHTVSRLQSIDNLIERLRLAHGQDESFDSMSPVEQQEVIIEEAARAIVEANLARDDSVYAYQGLLIDVTV